MERVFIYCHPQDIDAETGLSERLFARGHTIVRFNERFGQGPEHELVRDAVTDVDAIVILLTEHFTQSQRTVQEAGVAVGYAREKGVPIVLPVIFGSPAVPDFLRSIQPIVNKEGNLDVVAEQLDWALQHHIGRQKARDVEQRDVARRVEETAGAYIGRSREELNRRETRYRRMAYLWYWIAFAALVAGSIFAVWRAANANVNGGWLPLVEVLALGLVVVGLLVGVSKFAFALGKSFMLEALRNADRSHAISFGEFYLKVFGERAAWSEVKEAFQHWNGDKGASFSGQEAKDYDPQLMQLAIEIAKSVRPTEKPPKA